MWDDWRAHHLPGLPLAVMVAGPASYVDADGESQSEDTMDLRARLVFLGKCHDSMAGTGSMCTAAASRVPESVVHRAIGTSAAATRTLRIGHPLGIMEVKVVAEASQIPSEPHFTALGLTRTARRLMSGRVYVPAGARTST
jgi:2-methylaconitate cis-trans-isomerase PrpF